MISQCSSSSLYCACWEARKNNNVSECSIIEYIEKLKKNCNLRVNALISLHIIILYAYYNFAGKTNDREL